jgi:hypothetical protein
MLRIFLFANDFRQMTPAQVPNHTTCAHRLFDLDSSHSKLGQISHSGGGEAGIGGLYASVSKSVVGA